MCDHQVSSVLLLPNRKPTNLLLSSVGTTVAEFKGSKLAFPGREAF